MSGFRFVIVIAAIIIRFLRLPRLRDAFLRPLLLPFRRRPSAPAFGPVLLPFGVFRFSRLSGLLLGILIALAALAPTPAPAAVFGCILGFLLRGLAD
ncbi:MAG: hypothetical protein IKN55_00875, partial [Oscillospiraceae bacterium]|nr:hypothetical protein [Oscillospiraceae bacterium]